MPPTFHTDSNHIRILQTPAEFFEALCEMYGSCKERAVISCLYFGTGGREAKIVDALKRSCSREGHSLKVSILLDYFRGQRLNAGGSHSVSQLADLLTSAGDVKLTLFMVPIFSRLMNCLLPWRWREAMGVMHMKVFMADDRVILSGANLDGSYLTNRQDRYLLVRDKCVADWLYSLVTSVQAVSCDVRLHPQPQDRKMGSTKRRPDPHLKMSWGPNVPNPNARSRAFRKHLGACLERFAFKDRGESCGEASGDTTLLHFGVDCGFALPPIRSESKLLATLAKLRLGTNRSRIRDLVIASPYLNPSRAAVEALEKGASNRDTDISVVTGAAAASSFFAARGFARFLPRLYDAAALRLVAQLRKTRASVSHWSWHRNGWTFHAKGVWAKCGEGEAQASIIGSTNFNSRSLRRDLEMNCLIQTSNPRLKSALSKEVHDLLMHARPAAIRSSPGIRMLRRVVGGWL